jgi:hypothetical protein
MLSETRQGGNPITDHVGVAKHSRRQKIVIANKRFAFVAGNDDRLFGARRANHFGFSEIVSSPGIKNIPLSPSGKSVI